MTIQDLINQLSEFPEEERKTKTIGFQNPESGHILQAEIREESNQKHCFILY